MSGVDPEVNTTITSLGGTLNNTIEPDTDYKGTLFFLSTPTSRRRLKYILAAALGLPMLHYTWVVEIQKRWEEDGFAEPFESALFERKRLPTGLSLDSGVYPLQRARYARGWVRPGEETPGGPIFEGMRLCVALEKEDMSEQWGNILTVLGAKIVAADEAEAVLVDALSLPPHVTAVPSRVGQMLRVATVPILELSWAVQSIVQRKKLDFESDPRYRVTTSPSSQVYSMKVNNVRYEVGDTIRAAKKKGEDCFVRIVGMKREKDKYMVQVSLLIANGNYELMETKGGPQLTIRDDQLGKHLVLLNGGDFRCAAGGYVPEEEHQSHIFKLRTNS